jgi:hypothetical protein
MSIINLVIDTNILRKNPNRDKVEYKVLNTLVSNDNVKILMPYIIEQEFITQQVADCKKINNELLKNIRSLSDKKYTNQKFIEKLLLDVKDLEVNTCNLIQSEFDIWCDELKIEKRPLNKEHLDVVIKKYFNGSDPYKSQKNRNDIPDAFIFQELTDIIKEKGNLTFIAEDKYFRESCKKVGMNTYETLENFIQDSKIQFLLKEHEVTKEKFTELKEYLINNKDYLEDVLSGIHIKQLENQTITDYSIPSDDNTADIMGLNQPENIELDCMRTTYYGDNTIAIPVKFNIDVDASFTIFKSDYYGNEFEFSVADLNKHYYLAEREFTLEVTAIVILTIDINTFDFTKELTEDAFAEMVKLDTIEIDSIDSVKVKKEMKAKEEVTFICSNCRQRHKLSCEDVEWENVGSDERQMGYETQYEALYINTCKCGQKMNITFNCWEYPVGVINYTDVQSGGVDNIIGECVPNLFENEVFEE